MFSFHFQILFIAIAQVLMQLNSCINPFIYAYSIPAFKKIVKQHFKRRFDCRNQESSLFQNITKTNANSRSLLKSKTTNANESK